MKMLKEGKKKRKNKNKNKKMIQIITYFSVKLSE